MDHCLGCKTSFKKKSTTGYCANCFHANVDNIKTIYNAKRWKNGVSKKSNWKFRGAKLSEKDIKIFNEKTHCQICNVNFEQSIKCLDHCHKTGAYRGALCRQCNAALGKLGDDLDLIINRLVFYKKERP